MINNIEKHQKYIENKLKGKYEIDSISKLVKLPSKIKYFDSWSIGMELENYASYKITTTKGEVVYCMIASFFSFFILRSLYFLEEDGDYLRLYL